MLEEQDVVFTDRRTVWDPRRVRSAEPELKHGHGEIEIGHERMMAAIEDSKILEEPVHG